jgi:hypothetical protein
MNAVFIRDKNGRPAGRIQQRKNGIVASCAEDIVPLHQFGAAGWLSGTN